MKTSGSVLATVFGEELRWDTMQSHITVLRCFPKLQGKQRRFEALTIKALVKGQSVVLVRTPGPPTDIRNPASFQLELR